MYAHIYHSLQDSEIDVPLRSMEQSFWKAKMVSFLVTTKILFNSKKYEIRHHNYTIFTFAKVFLDNLLFESNKDKLQIVSAI